MGRGYLSVRVTDGKQVCRERKPLNSQGSPERAKAREPYQNLDEEGSPRSQLSPCQRLARVWKWSEAFLRTRKVGWL